MKTERTIVDEWEIGRAAANNRRAWPLVDVITTTVRDLRRRNYKIALTPDYWSSAFEVIGRYHVTMLIIIIVAFCFKF